MDTTTPFDLNRAIQRWRENLSQSPAFRRENLDELESHLRDSVIALEARGLSAEEAFMVAETRIGKGGTLEKEFAKTNRNSVWLDRLLWMLVGVQVWGLASGLIDSIARNGFAYGWRYMDHPLKGGGMPVALSLFTLVHVVAFAASIGFCWWLIFRKGGEISARLGPWLQRPLGFFACCIALCAMALLVTAFSETLSALLFRSFGAEVVGQAVMYSSYARLFVVPLQFFVMILVTLLLARKRLCAPRRFSATC